MGAAGSLLTALKNQEKLQTEFEEYLEKLRKTHKEPDLTTTSRAAKRKATSLITVSFIWPHASIKWIPSHVEVALTNLSMQESAM